MKRETNGRFNALMKEAYGSTKYNENLEREIKEAGYDIPPDFETLKRNLNERERETAKAKRSRRLKIAGLILAVFTVSGMMNIFGNSDFAVAGRFEVNNFMFSVRNGFVATDFQFNATETGRELIIEHEDRIPVGQSFLEELKIPGFIPEGYGFRHLHITNNARNEYRAVFVYGSDADTEIIVVQERFSHHNMMHMVTSVEYEFIMGDARVFHTPCIMTYSNTVIAFTESDIIQISGFLELDELVRIFERLE